MMRAMVLGSIAALLVAAAGMTALKLAGLRPQWPAALAALLAALAASILAGTPMALTAGASQMARIQAGLLATVIHLMALAVAAGVVILGPFSLGSAFIYWLAAMYVTTLIALVAAIIHTVHAVPSSGVKI